MSIEMKLEYKLNEMHVSFMVTYLLSKTRFIKDEILIIYFRYMNHS